MLRCGLARVVWYPDTGFSLGWCGIRMQASAWGGVVSGCRLQPGVVWYPDAGFSLRWCGIRIPHHTTPPQPNHNVTPTHIGPQQYNP